MTELRDARLKKALEAAPDAGVRPALSVSNTIRAAARNALPTAAPKHAATRWWLVLWQSLGQPRSAWGAAFATVLVAVLVTLIWVREPIPDARPVAPPINSPAPTAVELTEKKASRSAPEAAPATESAPKSAPKSAPAPVPAPLAAMAPATVPLPVAAKASPETPPDQAAQSAPSAKQSAETLSQRELQSRAEVAGAVQMKMAKSALPSLSADDSPSANAGTQANSLETWDTLSVQQGERSVKLDRAQGKKLFALVQRLQRRFSTALDTDSNASTGAPNLLIQVVAQEQVLATFTLSDQVARWTPQGRTTASGKLNATQLAQLMQAVREAGDGAAR